MKKIILAISIAILMPAIVFAGDIININKSNSKGIFKGKEVIVFIFEEESSRCKDFTPVFKETAPTIENFSFGLIDIKDQVEINGKLIAAGRVPTVYLIQNGKILENYEGSFDSADFSRWCRLMSAIYGKPSE